MAFGTGSRSFGLNSVLYSFKIRTKDLPTPIFEVSKKGADGKYNPIVKTDQHGNPVLDKDGKQIPVTASRVSGDIISASPKKGTYDGKDIHSVNLTIQDKDDVYFVGVGETFLGRNLYNSLLSLKAYDDIEIGLYQSKPKPDAVIKTGFPSVALRQHNELVKGAFDPKGTEMPKTKKVRVNGKDQTDSEELDIWFRVKMAEWCKRVNAAAPKQTVAAADTTHTPDTPAGDTASDAGATDDPTAPPF